MTLFLADPRPPGSANNRALPSITQGSRDAPGMFTHATGIVSAMNKWMIGAVIASLAGCAIVPKTSTTTSTVGHTVAEVPGPIRGLEVRARADASTLHVESVHVRRCRRLITDTVETRTATHPALDV